MNKKLYFWLLIIEFYKLRWVRVRAGGRGTNDKALRLSMWCVIIYYARATISPVGRQADTDRQAWAVGGKRLINKSKPS